MSLQAKLPTISREDAAKFLTDRGYKIKYCTLATFAHRDMGPAYVVWGNRALYSEADLLDWAESRRSVGPSSRRRTAV